MFLRIIAHFQTPKLFSFQLFNLLIIVDQCFPKAQDDILKCLVLSTTQRYSVYCHRREKKLEQYSHLTS